MSSSSSRTLPLVLFSAALCAMAAIESKPAMAETVPSYFFNSWTVARDCTEAHAGTKGGHTIPGTQLQVRKIADGSYTLVPQDTYAGRWARGWRNIKLEYRAGAQMAAIPADMECVPGQEES